MAMQWRMGEQPIWLSVEEKGEVPDGLLQLLLKEPIWKSLEKRGYAVLPLPEDAQAAACDMDDAMKAFCRQPLTEKTRFVSMMNGETFSPNEYHGYAEVAKLKEQFMIRSGGCGAGLRFPGSYPVSTDEQNEVGESSDFGLASVLLFQQLDQLCRRCLQSVAEHQKLGGNVLRRILDPVIDAGARPQHELTPTSSDTRPSVFSRYNVDGYVTSSLLDAFRYYNRADGAGIDENSAAAIPDKPGKKRYVNNHLSHTDSGIMTAVVSSAVPGLEVYDQLLKKWISLEKVIEAQAGEDASPVFAQYVSVFWGDSCIYLSPKRTTPTLHRVASCRRDVDRYAYVYKMRTRAEATAPRYQEDYALAKIQHKALEAANLSMVHAGK